MSLDDSAIRRITIPESFLCADACLILLLNIVDGLVVYEEVIRRRIEAELPFVSSPRPGRLPLAKNPTDGHGEHNHGMRTQGAKPTGCT